MAGRVGAIICTLLRWGHPSGRMCLLNARKRMVCLLVLQNAVAWRPPALFPEPTLLPLGRLLCIRRGGWCQGHVTFRVRRGPRDPWCWHRR